MYQTSPNHSSMSCRAGRLSAMILILFSAASPLFAAEVEETAAELVKRARMKRGLCAVVGIDGQLPLQLAHRTAWQIHVTDSDGKAAGALGKAADEAYLGISRLAVQEGTLARLPYADNMIDVLICARGSEQTLKTLTAEEVLRVLRPEGIAIVGEANPEDSLNATGILSQWAKESGAAKTELVANDTGTWIQLTKPPMQGADDWSHWEKGPDNNPVSKDKVIQAPYMTQFMAEPYYIGMPSITTAAAGRTFLAIGHIAHHRREWGMLNKIIARNGYNGIVLWERTLPEGYLVHRSAFIATKDTFHMIDGQRCLLLDAVTGAEKGEIRLAGVPGDWKWMVLKDDVLYVLAGKPEPGTQTTKGDRVFGGWSWADLSRGYYDKRIRFGFGDVLAAYDMKTKKVLWRHKEKSLIDARGMALQGEKLYLYCPDRHLRCLDTQNGDVVWTNDERKTLDLIEQPGKGLTSTPGFRTACLTVATPESLIIQGQTRMNVVAVSADDGYMRWSKKKITNNPNAIYVDGNVVLGVGPGGSHVRLDPVSGRVEEDLKFRKVACTRLTASGDSFFCRGEGMMRFDRATKKVMVDGAVRPACNDGALPANGLLYLGPWSCDCNLSLIGRVAKCSAGDFNFDIQATDKRLQRGPGSGEKLAAFDVSTKDWPTYRSNNQRTAACGAKLPAGDFIQRWSLAPDVSHVPTAPTAAGGLIFTAGSDGKVRAIDAQTGQQRWQFSTPSPIKYPPTLWEGRAFVGGGDGYVYTLEAATGQMLWRFRAAPVQRLISIYGSLSSTWPVNSGVLIHQGVAYFAAGIIDHDGTYVYALDAKTGKIVWQNNTSGHLNKELRKGVSVQGNLAIMGDRLVLAGGNQVSPVGFDLNSGKCLAPSFDHGRPKANTGSFVGVFRDKIAISGGRILYSAPDNVSTKGYFGAYSGKKRYRFNFGGIPPAWNDQFVAVVSHKHGKLGCYPASQVAELIDEGFSATKGYWSTVVSALDTKKATLWQSELGEANKFEILSVAVTGADVVCVLKKQDNKRAQPQWYLAAYDAKSGEQRFMKETINNPLPGGLLVDRDGQAVVTTLDGQVLCFGPEE